MLPDSGSTKRSAEAMKPAARHRSEHPKWPFHGDDVENRMDRTDLEPDSWLHQDIGRLQALLCRDTGAALAGNGNAWLRKWVCAGPVATSTRGTATAEEVNDLLRELDVGPVPREGTGCVRRADR